MNFPGTPRVLIDDVWNSLRI